MIDLEKLTELEKAARAAPTSFATECGPREIYQSVLLTAAPDLIAELRAARKVVEAARTSEYLHDPLAMAVLFHVVYERLAPRNGYETRTETRVFDPGSANGKLMIATCAEIQDQLRTALAAMPGGGKKL